MTKPLDKVYYNYEGLIETIAPIVVKVDTGDYQGDSICLLQDPDKGYGLLEFGWGSCSGCDALYACDSIEELTSLRDNLATSVKWLGSAKQTLVYINTYGDKIDHFDSEDKSSFCAEVREFLLKEVADA